MELWSNIGSGMATVMFGWAMFQQYFPYNFPRGSLDRYVQKLTAFFYPYIQITFTEFTGSRMKPSEAYANIQNYLTANSSATAKRLKADVIKDSSQSVLLSMDEREEVTDVFNGVKVWWSSSKTATKTQSFSLYPAVDKRCFTLTVHKRHREAITTGYIAHVLKEGRAIASGKRQRKLYTNNPSKDWSGWKATKWSHVAFEHPASFDTLAMADRAKEGIKKDLVKFSQGKDYYNKIGKAWKRGYLLYGPPGTGKSTMIAAMANFLSYDIYDLELTTVKDNSELRKLLIETTSKSIIVIEDIDCSLDLTGQRKGNKKGEKKDAEEEEEKEKEEPLAKAKKEMENAGGKSEDSKVTLSGLLNFIDGIWSACAGERIIVFTTNYVDKLDPALIRRGRMDKHIEMSYCCFEAFKLLARNYLDVEAHELFAKIEVLLGETKMTPADVAENLMLKSDEEDAVEVCLRELVEALQAAKEKDAKNIEEEDATMTKKSAATSKEE